MFANSVYNVTLHKCNSSTFALSLLQLLSSAQLSSCDLWQPSCIFSIYIGSAPRHTAEGPAPAAWSTSSGAQARPRHIHEPQLRTGTCSKDDATAERALDLGLAALASDPSSPLLWASMGQLVCCLMTHHQCLPLPSAPSLLSPTQSVMGQPGSLGQSGYMLLMAGLAVAKCPQP